MKKTTSKQKKKSAKPKSFEVINSKPVDPRVEFWKSTWTLPSDKWKVEFLSTFDRTKNIGTAVVACGINRTTVNRARRLDSIFEEALSDIWEDAIDKLEESALKRATEGTLRYNYDKEGNIVSRERKFETQLTIFMLQTNRKKYKIAVDGNTSLEDVVNKFHDITGRLKSTVPDRPNPSMN